ncbi:MAG TPA: hypothetical protein VIU61_13885 [Kofleriaceae bacterium]
MTWIAAVALLVAFHSHALAESDGHLLPVGLSTSRVWHETASDSYTLGAEASVVWIEASTPKSPDAIGLNFWYGAYLDLVRNFGTDTTRMTVGPELGLNYVGVDGGFMVDVGDTIRTGFVIRPVLTIGVVTLGYRYGYFFDDDPDNRFHELGLLIKWKLPFYEKL